MHSARVHSDSRPFQGNSRLAKMSLAAIDPKLFDWATHRGELSHSLDMTLFTVLSTVESTGFSTGICDVICNTSGSTPKPRGASEWSAQAPAHGVKPRPLVASDQDHRPPAENKLIQLNLGLPPLLFRRSTHRAVLRLIVSRETRRQGGGAPACHSCALRIPA